MSNAQEWENTPREVFTPMDKDWGLNRDEVQDKLREGNDKIKVWWAEHTDINQDRLEQKHMVC